MNTTDLTLQLVTVRERLQRTRTPTSRQTLRRWAAVGLALDTLMLAFAAVLEHVALRVGGAPTVPLPWLLAMPALTLAALASRGLYRTRLKLELVDDLRLIVGATSVAAMSIVTARVLTSGDTDVAGAAVH